MDWKQILKYLSWTGDAGMTIRKVVEVAIQPGKAADFRDIAGEFIRRVEAQEPDTLSYEWYLDKNQATCIILEDYRDNKALLFHLENIRDLYAQLFAVCEITRLRVFGDVSDEVRSAHMPQTEFFDRWSGISSASPGSRLTK